ncbi:MAG: hypothetical protein LBK75_01535 [Oscillospiraceae bacterium]|jgi:hypothetical protein|nr:hypothetical protein [Oscillospiraceae bacterium]
MKSKTTKIIIALVLTLAMSMSNFTAFAWFNDVVYSDSFSQDTQIYQANIAHATDINNTGTNLVSATIDESTTVENDYVSINSNSDSSINVTANIDGEEIEIEGELVGRTEDASVVFFAGVASDSRFNVVNFSYTADVVNTIAYFESENENVSSILKVYLLDEESETRDYFLIEVFDVTLNLSDAYIASLDITPLLGAWAATNFEPISSEFGEDIQGVSLLRAISNTKYWYCTKTYSNMGETQTHTIKWFTNVDYSNVPIGQEVNQYYRFEVYEKSMSFSVSTSLNSNTSSYLHIDGLSLSQISVGNTAWKSTTLDGYVQSNGWGGSLSADISISLGVLALTYSFPLTFSGSHYVDINSIYTGYTNGVNGNYTRSIKTVMDSDFKLTQNGHYFEVISALRDYGNASRSSSSMKARWNIDVINAGTMEVYPLYCDHNVNIAVN